MPIANTSAIEKACVHLLLREPFYGHFLMGIPKDFSQRVPTAAVSMFERQMVKLSINPDFWATLSDEHRYGLIKHEVLHIALRHLTMLRNFPRRGLFNVAADLVVNQFILAEQLPEGAVTLAFFKPLETTHQFFLEKEKGVDYYYEKLLQLLQNLPTAAGDGGETGGGGEHFSAEQKAASDDVLRQLERWLNDETAAMQAHQSWDEFAKLDSSEVRVMEQFVKNATRQALQRVKNKSFGRLPGNLLELLEAAVADVPQVNWRRALRLFAASSNSTFLKSTIRRPSKRYGTVPGIRLHRHHEIALAVDTSGSVGQEELSLFFSEIYHIWRQGARLTVIECDAAVRRVYPFRGIAPEAVAGRGGTSFDPPVAWANERLPDALIYFTDGFAPAPSLPSRVPILWVLTTEGARAEELPGQVVFLKN